MPAWLVAEWFFTPTVQKADRRTPNLFKKITLNSMEKYLALNCTCPCLAMSVIKIATFCPTAFIFISNVIVHWFRWAYKIKIEILCAIDSTTSSAEFFPKFLNISMPCRLVVVECSLHLQYTQLTSERQIYLSPKMSNDLNRKWFVFVVWQNK